MKVPFFVMCLDFFFEKLFLIAWFDSNATPFLYKEIALPLEMSMRSSYVHKIWGVIILKFGLTFD